MFFDGDWKPIGPDWACAASAASSSTSALRAWNGILGISPPPVVNGTQNT
jgi:hypothetical protein